MPNIDELSIQIEANSDKATAAIKNLTSHLNGLSLALNRINTNSITEFAKSIESLPKLSNVKMPDFTPFTEAISALNRVSTENVVKNINSVKGALDGTLPSAEALKGGLQKLEDVSRDSATNLKEMSDSVQNTEKLNGNFEDAANSVKQLGDSLSPVNQRVAEIIARIKELKQAIKNIEGGKFADIDYGDAVKELQALNSELAKIKSNSTISQENKAIGESAEKISNSAEGINNVKKHTFSFNAALANTAKIIDTVSQKLGKLGDYGIKGLKAAYTPLRMLANEYKEKLDKITEHFKDFQKNAQASLTKLSKFWQRVMKTFTFMLVRKAIIAIIKDVKEAVDELALFEKNLGTFSGGQFNKSLSEITADFHYIGRAIVAAFEPLINYVVPALNAVANAVANVLALVGEFFAAFTGQSYFVKAKKTVVDYGDSLDKNTKKLKEQKKLLLGIDEINNLPKKDDDSSSGSGGINFKDAFEEKPVSDKMKGIVDKIKDILGQLFAPLKAAWDNVGPYVLHEFGYLWDQIKRLVADIGRDFLTMWNEPETQRILESILRTVGNLAGGLGNLVYNFADSWETYGLGIFQKLRDNFGILQNWIEQTSWAFKNWARDVRFDNLLSAIDQLLLKTQALSNFIGGVFYDVMARVVMKYIEWMVETGIPHLITTIGEVIDAFDFEKIRSDLQILEDAFEHMAEQIDEGVTNAIGNVGKALAEWMNSDEFTKFCEALARFMDLITAERVEKLFTALGLGLLDTAKGLADFVTSEGFNKFVDKIIEWYDSKSAEEIAGYLEKIAVAIGLFKFAQFVGPGVAGFISFITTLMTTTNIASIAGDLSTLAGSTGAVGGAAGTAGTATGGFAASLGSIALPVGIVMAAIASLILSFGGLKGTLEVLGGWVEKIKAAWQNLAEKFKIDAQIGLVKDAFNNLKNALASLEPTWTVIIGLIGTIIEMIGSFLIPIIGGISTAFAGVINIVAGILNTLGGLINAFCLFVLGRWDEIPAAFEQAINGLVQIFVGVGEIILGALEAFVGSFVGFFADLKYQLIGDPIVIDMVNGILSWFTTLFTDGVQFISDLVSGVITLFTTLYTALIGKAIEIKDGVVGKFQEFKDGAATKFNEFKDGAVTKFQEVRDNVVGKAQEIKNTAGEHFNTFKTEAVKKFTDFKTNAGKAITEAKTNLVKLAGEIKKDFVDKVKEIPKEGKDKFNQLKTAANDKFNEVKSKIKAKMNESVDAIKEKLEKMKARFEAVNLESIASNIIRGFTNGLKTAWQGVVQWANQAISDLKQKFQSALKIQSPSKVFEEYGMYTVEGFNQGLDKFKGTTDKTVEEWVDGFSNVQVDLTPTLNTNSLSMPQMQNSILANNNAQNATQTNNTNNEIKVVLQLDGKTIYEQVVKQNNQQILRTGKSALAY